MVINKEKLECIIDNDILEYKEDSSINIIDLKKKLFIRENDESILEIDFKNSLLNYHIKNSELKLEDIKITTEMLVDNNIINLKYSIDNECKEIVVQIL